MAQYYTRRPKAVSGNVLPPTAQQRAPVAARDLQDELATPDGSFYIFPSPSESSSPSSPLRELSNLSSPTEIALSPCSEISSIAGSTLSTPDTSILTPVQGKENTWERLEDIEEYVASPPIRPHLRRPNHWTPRTAKKPLEPGSGLLDVRVGRGAPTQRKYPSASALGEKAQAATRSSESTRAASVESTVTEPSPFKASSQLPFLSFFASLLSADLATRDMISTSTVPSLFHSTASSKDIEPDLNLVQEGGKAEQNDHGIGKFVVSVSEEAPLFHAPVKLGVDHIPPIPFSFHISEVLQIVRGIGGQLLCVVFRV